MYQSEQGTDVTGANDVDRARVLGTIRGDAGTPDNQTTPVRVTAEGRLAFRRDLYVSIDDVEQKIEFLGRVVEGPFYEGDDTGPDGDGRTVSGLIEILGELSDGERLLSTATRPRPASYVYAFAGARLRRLLGIEGDYYLGRLSSSDSVPVHLDSKSKNFLPRNVGVFGTVGSGKSNTMQVMMEEAIQAGWAVVVIDVEGEYVQMDRPTADGRMAELLRADHRLEPDGIRDFRVYVPASGRSGAADPVPFKVPISGLEPEIVADILEFSEAHVRMFEAASRNAASRNEYLDRKPQPAGEAATSLPARDPGATSRPARDPAATSRPARDPVATSRPARDPASARLPGVPAGGLRSDAGAGGTAHSRLDDGLPSSDEGGGATTPHADVEGIAGGKTTDAVAKQRVYTLQDLIDGLQESNQSVPLIPRIRGEDLPTAASLRARLVHLGRSDVLDWNGTVHVPELPIDDLLVAGRLSVIDVAESDDRSRNIAIAYTLQALFDRVVETPIGEPMPSGMVRPPVLVVIEEVHTFVSRATAHRMRAVLDQLQVISRRGRKRWMALALVSQQPNHVPDELFELANTRFVHQMKSVTNLNAVRETTGGVHEALWAEVATLGPGQCLLTGSVLKNALLLNVRPARSQRLLSN